MVSLSKILAVCVVSLLATTTIQADTSASTEDDSLTTELEPTPAPSTTAPPTDSPTTSPVPSTTPPPTPEPTTTPPTTPEPTTTPPPTPAPTTTPPPTPAPTSKPLPTPAPTTKTTSTAKEASKETSKEASKTKSPTPAPTTKRPPTPAPTTSPPPTPTPTPAPTTAAPSLPPSTEPVFNLGSPTFFGSGCPAESLMVVPAADGQTVSILFSEFVAQTSPSANRDRRACNLAVPVTLQPGISIGIYRVDYRGYSYVPDVKTAYADMQVSYFFAGSVGPTFKQMWLPGADESIQITNKVGVSGVVWSPCGAAATTFRVNAAITAYKPVADSKDQVQIEIDTTDVTVEQGMRFYLTNRTCT